MNRYEMPSTTIGLSADIATRNARGQRGERDNHPADGFAYAGAERGALVRGRETDRGARSGQRRAEQRARPPRMPTRRDQDDLLRVDGTGKLRCRKSGLAPILYEHVFV